jgi:hypothetical protein
MAEILTSDRSAGFSLAFLQSFASEKDFLAATMPNYCLHMDEKKRKAELKAVYAKAKKLKEPEKPV